MKTEKKLRTELREKGLRKRTSKRLAADATSARAHGRPVPKRTAAIIDDLERTLREVRRRNHRARPRKGSGRHQPSKRAGNATAKRS